MESFNWIITNILVRRSFSLLGLQRDFLTGSLSSVISGKFGSRTLYLFLIYCYLYLCSTQHSACTHAALIYRSFLAFGEELSRAAETSIVRALLCSTTCVSVRLLTNVLIHLRCAYKWQQTSQVTRKWFFSCVLFSQLWLNRVVWCQHRGREAPAVRNADAKNKWMTPKRIKLRCEWDGTAVFLWLNNTQSHFSHFEGLVVSDDGMGRAQWWWLWLLFFPTCTLR